MNITEHVAKVRERIAAAAERAGRDPQQVRLVAATKYLEADRVLEIVHAGVHEIGENRGQDLRDKRLVVGDAVTWHFLGSVQTNKVRYLDIVQLVHSLDRAEEARALDTRAQAIGRSFDVLIEVNVSGETSKEGLRPDEVETFLASLSQWPLVRPRGLMVMAPEATDPQDIRWVFKGARELRDRLRESSPVIEELSMGMSEDFEVAVEEGATIVRVGRALYQGV